MKKNEGFLLVHCLIYVALFALISMLVVRSSGIVITKLSQEKMWSATGIRLQAGIALLERILHQAPADESSWLKTEKKQLVWITHHGFDEGLLFDNQKVWHMTGRYDRLKKEWSSVRSRSVVIYPVDACSWELSWKRPFKKNTQQVTMITSSIAALVGSKKMNIKSSTLPGSQVLYG